MAWHKREKAAWVIAAVLLLSVLGLSIWGAELNGKKKQDSVSLNNIYEKSYYQLIGHTQSMRNGFDKLRVSEDKPQIMLQLIAIKSGADMAEENASLISDRSETSMEYMRIVNQISDYCAYLMHEMELGKMLTGSQRTTLEELYQSVNQMNTAMTAGEKNSESNESVTEQTEESRFSEMENAVLDYPVLIYDGPFSETVYNREPEALQGKIISVEEGKKITAAFMGVSESEVESGPECNGLFTTYGYHIPSLNESLYVAVTKVGGHVMTVASAGEEGESAMTLKNAQRAAEAFLDKNGFDDMAVTYYQKADNEVTLNFAQKEQDIIRYSKLIKVKVSLVSGKINGFDAQNYYTSMSSPSRAEPALTVDEARSCVSSRLDITSEKLALIPGSSHNEILCYEFKGSVDAHHYIVYINAMTGKEEKIFKLIENAEGTLVI